MTTFEPTLFAILHPDMNEADAVTTSGGLLKSHKSTTRSQKKLKRRLAAVLKRSDAARLHQWQCVSPYATFNASANAEEAKICLGNPCDVVCLWPDTLCNPHDKNNTFNSEEVHAKIRLYIDGGGGAPSPDDMERDAA